MNKFLIYLLFIFLLYFGFLLFLENIERLIYFVPDDTFYYFKIAENISFKSLISFDNISPTNGFHPLWLILITPLFYFFKFTPEVYTKIVISFQLVLCFISIYLLFIRLKTIYKPRTLILVFSFFTFKFIENYVNGMESGLVFFIYVILFCYMFDCKFELKKNSINYFVLGVIVGLIVLARLDQIFLLSSFFIYFCFVNTNPLKIRVIWFFQLFLGTLIVVGPYLFANFIYFNNIIPISGVLKSSFPFISFNLIQIYEKINKMTVVSVIFSFWLIIIAFKKYKCANYSIMLIFCVSMLSHLIYSVLFMKWAYSDWQFSSYLFFGFLISFELYEFITNNASKRIGFVVFIILFILINIRGFNELYHRITIQSRDSWEVQSYLASQWVKQNLPKDAILAMSDTGIFSFFSERNVVNLDGLVNNFDYQDVLKNKLLNYYFKSINVKYLVYYPLWNQKDLITGDYKNFNKQYKSFKYGCFSDSIILKRSNEIYRSNQYLEGINKSVFLIWKLE